MDMALYMTSFVILKKEFDESMSKMEKKKVSRKTFPSCGFRFGGFELRIWRHGEPEHNTLDLN